MTCNIFYFKVYELYADYALKNPFYSLEMPIRHDGNKNLADMNNAGRKTEQSFISVAIDKHPVSWIELLQVKSKKY